MKQKPVANSTIADPERAATGAREREACMLQSIDGAMSGWLEQMAAMRRVESEFATRLAHCRTAQEAIAVCTEWMAKRVDSLVAVQHRLIDLWLENQTTRLGDWSGKQQKVGRKAVAAKEPVQP